MKSLVLSVVSLLAVGCGGMSAEEPLASLNADLNSPDLVPTGRGGGVANNQQRAGSGGKGNGIYYHGGPVMLGTTHIYYIYYGNWAGNSAPTVLADLANGIGGSPYYNINTTYTDGAGNAVANSATLAGTTTDNYSHGKVLADADVEAVVAAAISSRRLPSDTNGVYFVITSADVNESSGFCTQYCGYHTHSTLGGADIKWSFIGNPDRCPTACEIQAIGPNGAGGADGMASIIAHEFEEATSDPNLNAWFDRRGNENADKCAYIYGTTYTVNGAKANMKLGGRDFLIQQNWVNANGGACASAFP